MKKTAAILSAFIITASIVFSVVYATVGNVEKTLLYNDIRITLGGKELKPCDVNGNYIEPFIIEGTTYLPVRGIASSLGLTVGWNEKTNTVKLNEPANKTVLLYDERRVKLSFKKYEYTAEGDLKVVFRIENKNMNDIILNMRNVSVNGYMIPESGAVSNVAPEKISDINVVLEAEKLDENNITYVKEIELIADMTVLFTDEKYLDGKIITITPDSAVMSEKAPRPKKDYSQEFSYEEFAEFIRKNGSNTDGAYEVSHAFAVKDAEGNRPALVNISLNCIDGDKDICLRALVNYASDGMKADDVHMDVILSPNADSYSFSAKIISSDMDIIGRLPATLFNSDAAAIDDKTDAEAAQTDKLILKGWELSGTDNEFSYDFDKHHAASVFSDIMSFISEHGDGLFEKFGSKLTFKYFGM